MNPTNCSDGYEFEPGVGTLQEEGQPLLVQSNDDDCDDKGSFPATAPDRFLHNARQAKTGIQLYLLYDVDAYLPVIRPPQHLSLL